MRFSIPPRVVLFCASLAPCILLVGGLFADRLGANPIEFITHQTGQLTLLFLGLTLMITPAQDLFGWFQLVRYRRQLGLFAFFYASLHTLVYIGLDLGFYWSEIWIDIVQHPYIWAGLAAVCILLLLAVTSFQYLRRILKKNWKTLHRFVYLVAILGILHFVLLVKSIVLEPFLYGSIFAILLSWRLLGISRRRRLRVL